MNRLKKSEILKEVIEFVKKEGGISVSVAAEMFGISEVTARRYLNELAEMDSLPFKRIHGGLILETGKGSIEAMFDAKLSINEEEKKRIAVKALEFIEDGDSLILDSGTTSYQLARLLGRRKGLKVITVDIKVAEELAKNPEIKTYIVSGEVRPGYYSIGGDMAVEALKYFKVEKSFLTADAIDPDHGVTNSSLFEVQIKREIVKAGKKVILIADHTKLGKIAFVKVVPLNMVDIFITSKGANEEILRTIEKKGVKILIA